MDRPKYVILVTTILIAMCCAACSRNNSVIVPLLLGSVGASAVARIQVQEDFIYAAELQYEFKENDPNDRSQQWKLAGGSTKIGSGNWIEPCAPLKVSIKVHRKELKSLKLLAEEIVERPCLSSWGATSLNAELFAILLTPGTYEFTVESIETAPSFIGARTSLRVGKAYRGK